MGVIIIHFSSEQHWTSNCSITNHVSQNNTKTGMSNRPRRWLFSSKVAAGGYVGPSSGAWNIIVVQVVVSFWLWYAVMRYFCSSFAHGLLLFSNYYYWCTRSMQVPAPSGFWLSRRMKRWIEPRPNFERLVLSRIDAGFASKYWV